MLRMDSAIVLRVTSHGASCAYESAKSLSAKAGSISFRFFRRAGHSGVTPAPGYTQVDAVTRRFSSQNYTRRFDAVVFASRSAGETRSSFTADTFMASSLAIMPDAVLTTSAHSERPGPVRHGPLLKTRAQYPNNTRPSRAFMPRDLGVWRHLNGNAHANRRAPLGRNPGGGAQRQPD